MELKAKSERFVNTLTTITSSSQLAKFGLLSRSFTSCILVLEKSGLRLMVNDLHDVLRHILTVFIFVKRDKYLLSLAGTEAPSPHI